MHEVSARKSARGLGNARKQPAGASTIDKEGVEPNAPKLPKHEYRRHVIELHCDFDDILENLRLRLRLRSKTDVMQKAVQLLAVVVGDNDSDKRQLYLSVKGKLQELVLV